MLATQKVCCCNIIIIWVNEEALSPYHLPAYKALSRYYLIVYEVLSCYHLVAYEVLKYERRHI